MTLSHVVGGIGVAVSAYGLLKNQTVFSLSGLGIVIFAILMNPPPEFYTTT